MVILNCFVIFMSNVYTPRLFLRGLRTAKQKLKMHLSRPFRSRNVAVNPAEKFNTADYFFVSSKVAKLYPTYVSEVVASYSTQLPQQRYGSSGGKNVVSLFWLFALQGFFNLPPQAQSALYRILFTSVMGGTLSTLGSGQEVLISCGTLLMIGFVLISIMRVVEWIDSIKAKKVGIAPLYEDEDIMPQTQMTNLERRRQSVVQGNNVLRLLNVLAEPSRQAEPKDDSPTNRPLLGRGNQMDKFNEISTSSHKLEADFVGGDGLTSDDDDRNSDAKSTTTELRRAAETSTSSHMVVRPGHNV